MTPTNSDDIIEGHRKHKATAWLTENADPLLPRNKKPKTSAQPKPNATSTSKGTNTAWSASSRRKSIEIKDVKDEDGGEVSEDDGPQVTDVDDLNGEESEESAENELARLAKDWNSPIYAFFKPTPLIDHIDGRRVHIFECRAKHCKGKGRNGQQVRRYLNTGDASSTSNLRRHAKICWGEDAVEAAGRMKDVHTARDVPARTPTKNGSITAAFERAGKEKVTYSHRQHTKMETRAEIARWVAESTRPFQIVNDPGFQSLMKTGRPDYYIPSPQTVSRDVRQLFIRCRERIARTLQEYDGALSFATDAWTSPNHKAYVAITVHFEDKGIPVCMPLDLVEVAKSHSGLNLAAAFAKVLENFGISDKILSVTCDNASNNDTMIDELENLLTEFSGAASRTRCFAHIVNLVAKTVIRQFDMPNAMDKTLANKVLIKLRSLADGIEAEEQITRASESKEDDDDNDNDDNVEGWVDEREEMEQCDLESLEVDLQPARKVLMKLRKVSFAIKDSTTIVLPKWYATLDELRLNNRMMPRDVTTRWNSTYDMLEFAIEYQDALDAITGDRAMKLRQYEMDKEEWEIARQLSEALKVFKHATLFFSRGTPNIATVIPAMDYINKVLAANADLSAEFSSPVKAALMMGKKTLDRYYDITNMSDVYRIAMVLHPRHKLLYFKNAGWGDKWVKTAETIVRDRFQSRYKPKQQSNKAHPAPDEGVGVVSESASKNMFDDLPELAAPQLSDELERYLAGNTYPEHIPNVLAWWSERRHIYPCLSRMAMDYLSIPATSVDVERVFSKGRILLSHLRARLSVQSTRALMCVGEWSRMGLVKDSDVMMAMMLPEVDDSEEKLSEDWDSIKFK